MDTVDAKTAGPLIDERDRLEALDFEARVERFGWDELTVEQKIERMRRVVKTLSLGYEEMRDRLEQLAGQMGQHSHDALGRPVTLLDEHRLRGYGMVAGTENTPTGKVYF